MTNKEIRQSRKKYYKRLIRVFWGIWLLGLLGIIGFFVMLANSDSLPSTKELQNPKNSMASEVIASDGSVIGRYFIENRVEVPYDELSPHLISALVATEDERYHDHAGIDRKAMERVIFKTLLGGNMSAGGGSTISQQLAKLLYTEEVASSFVQRAMQKPKEWVTAVQLERRYTKEEIIAMYLNKFNFINGAYGIKSAAEIYFGKSQEDLNTTEAALLVGMLKNPSLYNPIRFPEKSKKRREVVLKQMVNNEILTEDEYHELRVTDLGLNFQRKTHSEGLAPYFREELRKEVKKILANIGKKEGRKLDVHRDGLKIYTTIQPKIQEHAEAAAWEHMKHLQGKFFKEWKTGDPWTWNAEPKDIKIRANEFKKVVRNSERYWKIRDKMLDDPISIMKNLGMESVRDSDFDRLIKEDEEVGYISGLKKKGLVTKKKAATYYKILRSDDWDSIKRQWEEFQAKMDKNFSTKTKMKVFHYNKQGERDTLMTPYDSIRYHRMHLQIGSLAVDPSTGAVRAWVGGINHKYFKFDHTNPSVERQVGSTFKPFIYATAIAVQGISPCEKVADIPYTIHPGEGDFQLIKPWTPNNSDDKFSGSDMTLQYGLMHSINSISTYLMKQLGSPKEVRELVREMGIDVDKKNVYGEPRVPNLPSIALGATDLSVYEMTGAYATFANNGVHISPYFIDRIVDENGKTIYKNQIVPNQALDPEANYVMLDMLKKVALGIQWRVKSEVAGKTGTTNNHSDGWFMGFTPELVVGTWVGGDDRWIRFKNIYWGQGGRMARPYFVKLIQKLEKDTSSVYNLNSRFYVPPGELGIVLDCESVAGDGGSADNSDNPFFDDNEGFGDEFDRETPIQPIPADSLPGGTPTNPQPISEEGGDAGSTGSDAEEGFGDDF